jgi:Fe-S cluster assembly iron-binding protein IscA
VSEGPGNTGSWRRRFRRSGCRPRAVEQIEAVGGSVRVDVEAGGCCGSTYVFTAGPADQSDHAFGCPGAVLAVSRSALPVLTGARLDYSGRVKPPRFPSDRQPEHAGAVPVQPILRRAVAGPRGARLQGDHADALGRVTSTSASAALRPAVSGLMCWSECRCQVGRSPSWAPPSGRMWSAGGGGVEDSEVGGRALICRGVRDGWRDASSPRRGRRPATAEDWCVGDGRAGDASSGGESSRKTLCWARLGSLTWERPTGGEKLGS